MGKLFSVLFLDTSIYMPVTSKNANSWVSCICTENYNMHSQWFSKPTGALKYSPRTEVGLKE